MNNILNYIIYDLKNLQAAVNLMNEIEKVYVNLEDRPKIYAYSEDTILKSKEYRKAVVPHYNYVLLFRINENSTCVYIVGFFHGLESFNNELI
ncbi:MAG TPA: type II toxin-antitoxin system RelE/ParE family toxin [Clostridiales bacterium]|nr:type II toxin-antitoxin system RelE/ParE family toxin [Clostridiales bacterium]